MALISGGTVKNQFGVEVQSNGLPALATSLGNLSNISYPKISEGLNSIATALSKISSVLYPVDNKVPFKST